MEPQRAGVAPWWQRALVYCLDVETFDDADGDGVGDLAGLRRRLDYLVELGVTCLWLLPLYPTPNRDDGYDVTDHCAVDPRLGTLAELEEVLRECDRSGIRVVLDLVANHTSDEHPWFVEARSDRSSPRRAYYVWSDTPCSEPAGVVFPGEVDRSWTYDPIAGQYYLHRYHPFQPDLDVGNPDVRAELERIIAFWLDRGVAGFRVDSAPFVIEQIGWGSRLADPHDVFRRWRSLATAHRSDAVLLGEAYLPPGQQADYFGDDDEFHALYDFHRNNGTWLALARASAEPLRRAFAELPDPPGTSRWFPFLRLHDELSFEKLPASERDAVLDAFSPTEETRIYGRGTRRRVAPMLGDDPARLRLAYSLLLSFPGSPVLLYGDELGLHDDLSLPGRTSVRVPMRWRPGRNGGFSEASREGLVRRVRTDAVADRANVEAQEEDPESLLRWLRRAVAARGRIPELTCGRGEVVETGDDAVFAHRCDLPGSSFVAVHNLSGVPRAISLSLDAAAVVDVLGDGPPPEGAGGALGLTLPRYGYRWLRVERAPASGAAATGSRPSRERASR